MKNKTLNIEKFLRWRTVYKYWILLTILVQCIITVFGFNLYTNLIAVMILAAGGTILGLAGLYWCWQKDWINAMLMFALFPIQCIAYIIAVFFRPVL